MKKAEMTTEAPAQTVDEAIDQYQQALLSTQDIKARVRLRRDFSAYIKTITGEDRQKALRAFSASF